ncbi:MAG: alkaline phosphatase [Cytophagaceae bacterium]|nr:alkaline phosphatase [Cytophagaceae bacterium]
MKTRLFAFFALTCFLGQAQKDYSDTPKLVVGIVVDQMRYDYLTRFYDRYGKDGLRRLMDEGFSADNNHYNYMPTYTAPGHASIYTGTTPRAHGIISNSWYDKFSKSTVYCVDDSTYTSVGTKSSAGQKSPFRLKTTTFTDQNRLHTQMRGKTIGIAIKDRASILPAGHTANGAYWFQGGDEGHWITSTFYMDELPQWVQDFNKKDPAKKYMKEWDTYYKIDTYVESGPDENDFEGGFRGKDKATFPYDLKKLGKENGGYGILSSTPYGNSLTADFAIEAIDAEELGKDDITDILAVSFSSTDYVGHNFGVNSKEIEDTYIRLDMDIARLLKALDDKVGKGNYTVFLTADHAAINNPGYLKSKRIPAGSFHMGKVNDTLNSYLTGKYGDLKLIENISNYQVFFDYDVLAENNINRQELQKDIAHFLLQQPNVDKAYTREELTSGEFNYGEISLVQKGFNQKRSGDVFIVIDPGYAGIGKTGSTHGSPESYDTHVPLLFYGKGINNGKHTDRTTTIPDIAATVAALLNIEFPSGEAGEPILEALAD